MHVFVSLRTEVCGLGKFKSKLTECEDLIKTFS